jgi:pimeloyl-ACP methyl ester carboxylesterase
MTMKQHPLHQLHVRSTGTDADDKILLYLHGLGESGLCFENIITHPMLEKWNHIVPDLPGYGKSYWPDKPLSLDAQADLLNQWIEKNCWTSVILIGHSMGGVLGTIMCEKYPIKIRGFINIEGNMSPGDCAYSGQAAGQSLTQWLDSGFFEFYEQLYRLGQTDMPHRGYYASVRMCDPATFYQNSVDLVTASETRQLATRLARLPMPFCYIGGTPRGVVTESQALLSAAGIPWQAVDNAGHWPFLDHPDQFIKIITDFLSQFNA